MSLPMSMTGNRERVRTVFNEAEKFFAIGVEDEDVEEALTYYREREPKV